MSIGTMLPPHEAHAINVTSHYERRRRATSQF